MRLGIRRRLWISAGFLSLVLGIIGIPLPLLPTTPFLLLAAFCFSRGSDKFHDWLVNHAHFGPPIRDWRRNRAIAFRVKVVSTLMMLGGYALLLLHPSVPFEAKVAYPFLVSPVMLFIWTRNSR
jgi:uncharacterized protein